MNATPDNTLADPAQNVAELRRQLAERVAELAKCKAERDEALEYQTATSDVLKVISQSTFDLQPVLDTLVATAKRLCNADMAIIYRRVGDAYRLAANLGFPPDYEAFARTLSLAPSRASVTQRAALERRISHVADIAADPEYELPEAYELGNARTALGVPLLREGEPVGVFTLARQRVEPFSEKEIALVSTFADQAVIAMENARLLTETREALEQQTATAEVLEVINSSPGDLGPVFQALLRKAHTLCEASFGALMTYDGERFHAVAHQGTPAPFRVFLGSGILPGAGDPFGLMVEGAAYSHIHDLLEVVARYPGEPLPRAAADLGGIRTLLVVPLRKDSELLGVITAYRQEMRPFSDKQIALLQNFAAQAVIAMENARLLTEQREALEQQTATAEVLGVINASPGNLAPVFDAMLEKAMRLCGAAYGVLRSFDGERAHLLASRGVPSEFAGFLARNAALGTPPAGTDFMRALQTGQPTQTMDARESVGYRSGAPGGRAIADLGGARTILHVPLVKDQVSLGLFTLYRQEVRSFSGKQIALLENFAAQAVIAMENARLLTETREALEQQTATTEVLQVINASPGNLAAVFNTIGERAIRLCEASFGGLMIYDGTGFKAAALGGVPPAYAEFCAHNEAYGRGGPGSASGQLLAGADVVHFEDLMDRDGYRNHDPRTRALVDLGGARTLLGVALRKDDAFLGAITIYRQRVRPFTDRQIRVLRNFADQAVIAIESARLLNELRDRTDELAQRQAELRVTFENMGDGVAMFDETQHLIAWNGKFREIFDLPDALLEPHCTYQEYLRFLAARGDFGPGVDTVEQITELVASTGQPYGYERTRPDGRVIETRRNPVPEGGFVLIYSDITERKRSEEEVRAARDAAETALRNLKAAQANLIQAEKMASLGQLTAGIAHEIKNPLNFVNNFATLSVDLLDELKQTAAPGFAMLDEGRRAEIDDLTSTLSGNLEKINVHGNRADAIVRSMLEHSRGSSGERRAVNLNALVEEALNLAYHGARAQDQSFNITRERDFDEGIAPITLVPQDMTRVLLNLFSNGFYAARRRQSMEAALGFEPALSVATRELGDAVEIRVRDNGIGIPEEVRDKLFQPFFTTKPTGEGTGLGLSITYDIIVQQHGGSIAVDSKVGEYSEFTVWLPRNP